MEETFMMNEEFLTLTIGKQKNIALIAQRQQAGAYFLV